MKVKLSVLFIIIVSFLTACRPYNLEHFAPVITSDKEKAYYGILGGGNIEMVRDYIENGMSVDQVRLHSLGVNGVSTLKIAFDAHDTAMAIQSLCGFQELVREKMELFVENIVNCC